MELAQLSQNYLARVRVIWEQPVDPLLTLRVAWQSNTLALRGNLTISATCPMLLDERRWSRVSCRSKAGNS